MNMEWIDIRETGELPAKGDRVLVIEETPGCNNTSYRYIRIAYRYRGEWRQDDHFICLDETVTHWMPLPTLEGRK